MATSQQTRKQRTLKPYHRKFDGWWYACSKRFLPMFGTERIKLVKGPKDRETEHTAIIELKKILDRIDADSLQEDMSLGVLADKYLEWLEGRVSVSHFTQVQKVLCDLLEYYGNEIVKDFGHDKMDRWLKANTDGNNGKFNWESNNSQYRAISTVKAMFRYGCDHLKINRAVCDVFTYENPDREVRVTYFTPEQEKAILETLRSENRFQDRGEFADFFSACIELGSRTFVETASFTRDKIEWDNGEPICFDMGKVKEKTRYVYLTPKMQAVIKRLAVRYPTGPLFRNSEGEQWKQSTASRRINRVINHLIKTKPELGLTKDHSLYSCRHTFIVRKLIETGNVALVAEMAGNTIAVLEKHYKKWGSARNRIMEALGHDQKNCA